MEASKLHPNPYVQDCWHYGVVEEHLRLKHAYLSLASRAVFIRLALVFAFVLLVAQAPIFHGIDVSSLSAESERRVYLRQVPAPVPTVRCTEKTSGDCSGEVRNRARGLGARDVLQRFAGTAHLTRAGVARRRC